MKDSPATKKENRLDLGTLVRPALNTLSRRIRTKAPSNLILKRRQSRKENGKMQKMPESKFVITRGPLEYNDEDEAKKEAFRLLLQNPDVKKVYVARIFGIYEVEPPKYKYKRL